MVFNVNEGLGLFKLADTSLILINPNPSNVNSNYLYNCNPRDLVDSLILKEAGPFF